MSDQFVYTTPLDPLARPLVEQLTWEYVTRYGSYFGDPPGAEMTRYPAELFAPPDGSFVLLVRDGRAIAGGAFKRYDDHTAELKRVWTDTQFRRQGLARRVVEELEAEAGRQGYDRIYLTTGFRQPEAKGLYLDLGYTPLFDVSLDPEIYKILPFEKALRPPAAVAQQLAAAVAACSPA
ncbi:GNAT family N-acetyltransferase [Methylobacterium pseudosasicola]|uniref:Acetyltransferase (GNAT) family protein n=1 Tax=Methylobacterium pseudosasicola TaxID=582667 RepID=A0A1I4Q7U0_9HYPH|nr:GNAT family N-acetyltransferase [Methylobacterium pseudosasicola]SFM35703.1 Acetyltransferase (GNAT) family protein [Methylobacterium pseudosasicola]